MTAQGLEQSSWNLRLARLVNSPAWYFPSFKTFFLDF